MLLATVQLIRGLYLGGITDARDVAALKAKGVTHVVDCSVDDDLAQHLGGTGPPFAPRNFRCRCIGAYA
eukprot:SAG11_NODE_8681_length_987_cov_2.177928_1_plen_68_part_10